MYDRMYDSITAEMPSISTENSRNVEIYLDETFGRLLYRQWKKTLKVFPAILLYNTPNYVFSSATKLV